jgi:transposase-like protein
MEATFPAGLAQTCFGHLVRASLRYVNYRDQRKVAAALRPVYTAPNADARGLSSSASMTNDSTVNIRAGHAG